MLSGGMSGRFHKSSQGNPAKVVSPRLAPKISGLGFSTFPVFWG